MGRVNRVLLGVLSLCLVGMLGPSASHAEFKFQKGSSQHGSVYKKFHKKKEVYRCWAKVFRRYLGGHSKWSKRGHSHPLKLFKLYKNLCQPNEMPGDDVVVSNFSPNEEFPPDISILLGNGDGTFNENDLELPQDPGDQDVVAGDFNNDSDLDLAVANANNDTITIILGNGNGTFDPSPAQVVGLGNRPFAIATGLFDNDDSNLDLAVTNGAVGVTILLGNGDGTFEEAPTGSPIPVGDGPQDIVTGFFNNEDSNLDLALTNFLDDTVTILLGNGDGTFMDNGELPGTVKQPFSLVAGDFDNDSNLDLAVTNFVGGGVESS